MTRTWVLDQAKAHFSIQIRTGNLSCSVGFRVGRQLAERYTWERPRLVEQLDVMKFICKEFWIELFQKQVHLSSRGSHAAVHFPKA